MKNTSRIMAILIKEMQDVKSNSNILFMFLIPIMLMLIYKYLIPGMPEGLALSFGLLFLAVMIGMYVPSMIIAEEKEKKTLQVLLISPANPAEVFIGKGLLTFVSIFVFALILMSLDGGVWNKLPLIMVSLVLVSVPCIFIGMIVGMFAQNQMATGTIGFPIYMLFLILPLLATIGSQDTLETVSSVLPTYHFMKILQKIFSAEYTLAELYPNFVSILAGCVVVFALLYIVYRKKGLEQ